MKRSVPFRLGTLVTLAALLAAAGGCNQLFLSNGISAVSGWLLRGVLISSGDVTCYQNGVQIDCAQLPDDLQP